MQKSSKEKWNLTEKIIKSKVAYLKSVYCNLGNILYSLSILKNSKSKRCTSKQWHI